MAVIRETDWYDGAHDWDALEPLVRLFADGMFDPALVGCCVVCRREQPHDVLWPRFGFELQRKSSGESSGDIELACCPRCEPKLDALMERLGAHPPDEVD